MARSSSSPGVPAEAAPRAVEVAQPARELTVDDAEAMQREMNGSTPYCSMSALPWIRSSFSTSTSTGSPCVSQPAFRGTSKPRIVL